MNKCMNDLTDTQPLSKKNDKQQLFTSESTVTWDAVKTMNREVNGKAVTCDIADGNGIH